jgi:DoxX-like family
MFPAVAVISLLLAAMFLGVGTVKLVGIEWSLNHARRLGYPVRVWRGIGALEVAAALGLVVGLFVAPLGVAAAAGSVLLMVGAVISHLRVGDGPDHYLLPAVLAVLAAVVVVLRILTA